MVEFALKMATSEAVRRGDDASAAAAAQLQDSRAVMNRPSGQFRSTGIQVNLPETLPATTEKPNQQHVVDEEAILQLMKNCPMCNRKCRCIKHTRGPYLIVYQGCYFCSYQRKWASQPEVTNINFYKAYTQPKRKSQAKETNTRTQINKSRNFEDCVSESHNK